MDDRAQAKTVELTVDQTGKLWVNVDDVCVARVGRVGEVLIDRQSNFADAYKLRLIISEDLVEEKFTHRRERNGKT